MYVIQTLNKLFLLDAKQNRSVLQPKHSDRVAVLGVAMVLKYHKYKHKISLNPSIWDLKLCVEKEQIQFLPRAVCNDKKQAWKAITNGKYCYTLFNFDVSIF
jgi:hypothetical protein